MKVTIRISLRTNGDDAFVSWCYPSSGMTQRGARPAATRWMLSKPFRKRAVQFSHVGPAECGVRVTLGSEKSG